MENYWQMKNCAMDEGAVQKKVLKFHRLDDLSDPSEMHKLLLSYALSAKSILDFGAGEMRFKELVIKNGYGQKGQVYKTLDVSPEKKYDYRDIQDVKEKFDLILCCEVIEH